MLRRMVDLGANLDWMSPIGVLVQSVINGPSHGFVIPRACGWSGKQIMRLMREHGITAWGMLITAKSIMFVVKRNQAGWAQYLLQRHGIPIEQGVFLAQSGSGNPRRPPGKGILKSIDDGIAHLENVLHL